MTGGTNKIIYIDVNVVEANVFDFRMSMTVFVMWTLLGW